MFNVAIHIVSPEKKNVMTHKKTISAFLIINFNFTDVHVLLKMK